MTSPAETVTATLQRYADRGVFRGFRVEAGRGGRVTYQFTWLLRRPMRVAFDPARRTVVFRDLLPSIEPRSPMARALAAVVGGRADRRLPAHKRLDPRKARVAASIRRGELSLTLAVRGPHHDYALRNALNLVNELFLLLHETYPDYLIEHFGLSSE